MCLWDDPVKLITLQSAPTFDAANAVARSVASSSLVKTAMYGEGKHLSFPTGARLISLRRELGTYPLRRVSGIAR